MWQALRRFSACVSAAGKTIAILTDSRSLTTHLEGLRNKPRPVSETVYAILDQFTQLYNAGVKSISVVWIPGHAEIGFNPLADEEATAAYDDDTVLKARYPASFYSKIGRRRV